MIEQSGAAGWYRGIKNIDGTIFFVKYSSSQDKIWYVNDSMTEPDFFDINIGLLFISKFCINSPDFF